MGFKKIATPVLEEPLWKGSNRTFLIKYCISDSLSEDWRRDLLEAWLSDSYFWPPATATLIPVHHVKISYTAKFKKNYIYAYSNIMLMVKYSNKVVTNFGTRVTL